jgi:Peptidase family S41
MRVAPILAAWVIAAIGACAGPSTHEPPRVVVPTPCPACPPAPPSDAGVVFDSALWVDDFHQLLDELASHYANLESARDDRRMDLPSLRRSTEKDLREAKTREAAEKVLQNFLRAFGDGHLSVESPTEPSASPPPPQLCERLGYGKTRAKVGVDFSLAGGFDRFNDVDQKDFPGGMLTLGPRVRLGVVRIGLFVVEAYPKLCDAALKELGLTGDAACDEACRSRVELAVSNSLLASLERRYATARDSGAAALLVDLTNNGGGSDWVDPAARETTPTALHAPRLAFPRHPHWTRDLKSRLEDVERDLSKAAEARKPTLEAAAGALRSAIAETERPCDLRGVWDGAPTPPCSMLVRPALFASGALPYAKIGALTGLDSEEVLFKPSQYRYREGANVLPVILLVDGNTASAAELFVSMLKDNGAATVVGSPTAGAGCGYTNGGVPAVLHKSGLKIRIPDCVRLRADGSDEVTGITPDVLVAFTSHDSPYQRAVKSREGLIRAWKDVGKHGSRQP